MSAGYVPVQWTPAKRAYDGLIVAGVTAYLAIFFVVSKAVWRAPHAISDEIIALRALGSCAALMLHLVLCIGPLARLDRRFLPLLYNRRHLGVAMFCVALAHGTFAIVYYHGFGTLNPLISLLVSNTRYDSLAGFPYQVLGFAALLILFLMAATSHDFWLKNLSPATWKSLHMLVYPAYGLVAMHIVLGALQGDRGGFARLALLLGVLVVAGLHIAAGWREWRRDARGRRAEAGEWLDVGRADEIPLDRARVVCLRGRERVAVFRHAGGVSAVANVCAHQGGPVGEGKIVDGCITCPWHGWQYRPEDGRSPPPFEERIATYPARVENGRVLLHIASPGTGAPAATARREEQGDG